MKVLALLMASFLFYGALSFAQEDKQTNSEFEAEYLGDFLDEESEVSAEKEDVENVGEIEGSAEDSELDLDSIDLDAVSEKKSQLPKKKKTAEKLPEKKDDLFDEFEAAEESSFGDVGGQDTVKDIRFYSDRDGGTVLIETSSPVNYKVREDKETSQVFIELPGVDLPRKLQRPLITSGFATNIGAVNAYQPRGSSQSVIVFQKKSSQPLVINQSGSQITIASQQRNVKKEGAAADTRAVGILGYPSSLEANLVSQQKFYGRKISLMVEETPLEDVLQLIAEESGVNIIVSSSVEGTAKFKLREVPWDQALALVLKTHSLGYQRLGNVLRITTLEELKQEAESLKQVAVAKITSAPLVFKVIPVSYAKVDEMSKQIKPFLSARGKISEDKRTNSVLVNDLALNVQQIEKLIQSLDLPPPQVLIEGKIIEAQEDFSKELGVSWGFGGEATKIGTANNGSDINITPSLDIANGNTTGNFSFNLNIGTLDLIGDLTSRLALSERQSKVKVISSPRVLTLSNEQASILDTTEIPLITQTVDQGTVTRGVTFKPVELQLIVTPQVTADNSVVLSVDLSRAFAGAVVEQETQARPINKRTAKTKVLVKNGQTAVLGGIYQSDSTNTETGVPYLRKVPLLGHLFESSSKTQDRRELMIFLTPRVISEAKKTSSVQ